MHVNCPHCRQAGFRTSGQETCENTCQGVSRSGRSQTDGAISGKPSLAVFGNDVCFGALNRDDGGQRGSGRRAACKGFLTTSSRRTSRNVAISPECGVTIILPTRSCGISTARRVENAKASSTNAGPFRRLNIAKVSSATAAGSVMPGPITTASQSVPNLINRSALSGSIPPPLVSLHPITIASGMATPRWAAFERQVAICRMPEPALSDPSPASNAAPGISTLPATTSTRPLDCLSPSIFRVPATGERAENPG